jgi:hypothetical protein
MYVTTFIIKAKKVAFQQPLQANTYNKCERSQNHATNERAFPIEYLGPQWHCGRGERERDLFIYKLSN